MRRSGGVVVGGVMGAAGGVGVVGFGTDGVGTPEGTGVLAGAVDETSDLTQLRVLKVAAAA